MVIKAQGQALSIDLTITSNQAVVESLNVGTPDYLGRFTGGNLLYSLAAGENRIHIDTQVPYVDDVGTATPDIVVQVRAYVSGVITATILAERTFSGLLTIGQPVVLPPVTFYLWLVFPPAEAAYWNPWWKYDEAGIIKQTSGVGPSNAMYMPVDKAMQFSAPPGVGSFYINLANASWQVIAWEIFAGQTVVKQGDLWAYNCSTKELYLAATGITGTW